MLTFYKEPVLFNGTVFENICNGLVGTPWEYDTQEEQIVRVKEAAKTAFAHEFIANLPQGYDTQIGEKGGLLSGGQKQRIAIARSIISKPRILLLDEATSALDPGAEAIVQKALDEVARDRTTLVIAHKLKTIQNADNIVVMKHGQIVEMGRHNELVARGGTYATLVRAQELFTSAKLNGIDDVVQDADQRTPSLQKRPSLRRHDTSEREKLESLSTREDYRLAPTKNIFSTATRLVRATPDLKWWYVLALLTSVFGGKSLPVTFKCVPKADRISRRVPGPSFAFGQRYGCVQS